MPAQLRSVVVSAVRTPVGRLGGSFRDVPAAELGAVAIRGAVEAAAAGSQSNDPALLAGIVDYVLMGQVLQAGAGQNPARQAAVAAGLPVGVPAVTVNKVCLASLAAIAFADQMIRAGEIDVAVAGGMESMSMAPYLLREARFGHRLGTTELVDSLCYDGLYSTFSEQTMGESSDDVNEELAISRPEQDAWAARSHRRAAHATAAGLFGDEIVELATADGRTVSSDEGIRESTTAESLGLLQPAFSPGGTITAGNASQLSDGAAALVVMSEHKAEAMGLAPLAAIVSHGMCAEDFAYLHTVPAIALERALKKEARQRDSLGLIEINEAFAAVALHATRMLEADEEIVNVNGGSVALGHALGSTGARMTVTLLHEMKRRRLPLGAVTLCGGGGQGEALLFGQHDGAPHG